MKSLESETIDGATADECAAHLMDVVPLVMATLRAEIRSHRRADLSVPQFRALAFLRRHEGASLSDVAEHVGLTLPSVSKLIDALVARQLVVRQTSPNDRRRVTLTLTAAGQATLQVARQATQARLADLLRPLPPARRATVVRAMHDLRPIFAPGTETEAGNAE